MSISREVAIVGIGETEVGRVPGKSVMQLHAEAAKRAIEDAGLRKEDIDGVLSVGSRAESFPIHSTVVCEYLQIVPKTTAQLVLGGAGNAAMIFHAATAIAAGVADTILCVCAESLLSGLSRDAAVAQMADTGHPQYEQPYGALIPSMYGLAAQRHMHEYGTTPEDLAAVAVTMRRHAARNPAAQMRAPITIDDVLNSKMIASPLHILDCSLVSDGGAAVIVTTAERAKDLRKPPVYLLGAGEGHGHEHISQAASLTSFGCRASGEHAYRMAGLGPKDMDFAMLYDCFTITVLIELEDLGFVQKGEAGVFFREGRADLGGDLPVNTHGGLLSHAHPGRPGGMFHITEAVRQLRGEAGERQVPGAQVGMAHCNGGILSTHCTLILGRN